MTSDKATITSVPSIIFCIPAQLKDTQLLNYSVYVISDIPGITRTIACQLKLALIKASGNIFKFTDLAKDKTLIGMTSVQLWADKTEHKRANGKNVLTLPKYFTC